MLAELQRQKMPLRLFDLVDPASPPATGICAGSSFLPPDRELHELRARAAATHDDREGKFFGP